MALPTTSLSFSALQAEFGGSNPISLSEYTRGGTNVPSGTTSAYGTIPTTNSNINMGVFRGTQKVVEIVNISDHSVYVQRQSYGDGPSSALAKLSLSPSGVLSLLGSTAYYAQYGALGEINLDGSDYFDDTEAGSTSGVIPVANQWLQSGTPSLYSARATISSGATPNGSTRIRTGTFGSWLPLTSTVEWTMAAYSTTSSRDNIMNTYFTLDIALTSDATKTVIDTAMINLIARAQTASGDLP
jgi:hypothetical protein